MAHLEEDIIERAKNTDMIALLESEEGFSFKSTYGEREFKCIEHNSLVVTDADGTGTADRSEETMPLITL